MVVAALPVAALPVAGRRRLYQSVHLNSAQLLPAAAAAE